MSDIDTEIEVRKGRACDWEAVVPRWAEMTSPQHELRPRFRPGAHCQNRFSEFFRRLVADRHACVLVAEVAGTVVGYTVGTIRVMHELLEPRFVGYVTDISVNPAA